MTTYIVPVHTHNQHTGTQFDIKCTIEDPIGNNHRIYQLKSEQNYLTSVQTGATAPLPLRPEVMWYYLADVVKIMKDQNVI